MQHLVVVFAALTFLFSFSSPSFGDSKHGYVPPRKYVAPSGGDIDSQWADGHSQWDFSGVLGFYNPGFGFEALASYRIVDNLINNVDESLSVESGLGYFYASDSYQGVGISYSEVEIPFMARWDFRIPNTKIIVGPRAGFNYLTAGTATVNGVQVTQRGGALYFQLGGFGMYQINEHWGGRVQLMFINYTAFTFGAVYFL